jgi:hypothetical protein
MSIRANVCYVFLKISFFIICLERLQIILALGVGSSDLGELHSVHGPSRGLPQGHSGDPQEKL